LMLKAKLKSTNYCYVFVVTVDHVIVCTQFGYFKQNHYLI